MSCDHNNIDTDELKAQLRTVLLYTEHSGNTSSLYRLSYAGAASSYSFGLLQFDVAQRTDARTFLSGIGFTNQEIANLSGSSSINAASLQSMNERLAANSAAVDQFAQSGIDNAVAKLDSLINDLDTRNPDVAQQIRADEALQLALIDYDNQFNISGIGTSSPGSMLAYLRNSANGRMSFEKIAARIDQTVYGQNNPTQVTRLRDDLLRALNLLNIPKDPLHVCPPPPPPPPPPGDGSGGGSNDDGDGGGDSGGIGGAGDGDAGGGVGSWGVGDPEPVTGEPINEGDFSFDQPDGISSKSASWSTARIDTDNIIAIAKKISLEQPAQDYAESNLGSSVNLNGLTSSMVAAMASFDVDIAPALQYNVHRLTESTTPQFAEH